jgi:hypothetical protein
MKLTACYKVFFAALFSLFTLSLCAQQIAINEFMSSNAFTLADEDGEFNDWIEIYNYGTAAVALDGFGLSDNQNNPFKWTFPDISLAPGEHLLVWASGKNRRPTGVEYTNGLLRQVYSGIPGTAVSDLTNHPSYPNSPSSVNAVTGLFEAPLDVADQYGQRIHGWIKAPQTGHYIFWIASDDNSELHLSTSSNPGDAVLIAGVPGWTESQQWNKYSQQQSAPIFLVQGQYYYVKALMKEHGGGDNLAVGWQLPTGGLQRPIGGEHLFRKRSELHTNFSIKSSGEEILLTDANGSLIDEVAPVNVPTDVSHGRKPDGTGAWYFFDEPTPGSANIPTGYNAIQTPPVFSHPAGTYTQPFALSLQSDAGATIYYTTNGETPTPQNGTLYTSLFTVTTTVRIRARAYRDGYLPSRPETMVYSRIGADLQNFSSNLPLIILHEFNQPITSGDRTPASAVFIDHNNGGNTQLTGEIALHSKIMANIRGNSSQYFYPKKMYGFHIVDDFDMNRDEELFGMPAEHNWILNGPYGDKSLMRNAIAYNVGASFGRWAPRVKFVEVFLHSGSGPVTNAHYNGVYILVERIKWGENRVNITQLEPGDNAEPEISGGYIIKKDRLNEGEQGMTTTRGTTLAFVRPNENSATSEQKAWIRNYINDFENALYGPNFTNPANGYHAYIDANSFIDHFLVTELFKEIDGYRLSTFMYKDRNQKLVMGPVWDFNLSLGNGNYLSGWIPQGWYYPLLSGNDCYVGCGVRNWYTRLLEDPAYDQATKYRWWQLRQDLFSNENLSEMISEFSELLAEAQVRNFNRWPILGQYVWPNWYIAQTYQDELNWMNNWLMTRLTWMDNQMGDPPVFPEYNLLYYWLFDNSLPNDTPLESIAATYEANDDGLLQFHSALEGYPFSSTHPNWRKASMERRNSPTAINYRPEGNNGIPFGDANMRGIQIKQPFTGDGGENTLYFHLPTNNFENVVFRFAAKDEGAATHLLIDYSVSQSGNEWISTGLPSVSWPLSGNYQLYEIDFSAIPAADNNSHFKIRIRFNGPNMSIDNGDRVTFNNFSLDGEALSGVNLPPLVANPPGFQEMIEAGSGQQFNMNEIFIDPNDDPLTFLAFSNNENMVGVTLAANILTINPLQRGEATITLSANDGVNDPVLYNFRVLVYPAAMTFIGNSLAFGAWDPEQPEYTYPPHMLFLQSDISDPDLGKELLFAYYIPHDDYHADDQGTIGFPYNNTGRTRINGLGEDGVSFINTGRNRDLGGALLALDTRGIASANVSWLAGTLLQNSRVYALRLQYRLGHTEPFSDLLHNGQVVEYIAGADGEVQLFENIELPSDLLGKEYIQLLWRYYLRSGTAGPRAQLRLDNIEMNFLTGTSSLTQEAPLIYADGNSIFVKISSERAGNINIFDLTGRKIAGQAFAGASIYQFGVRPAKAIYIVQIITDEGVTVQKVLK